MSRMAIENGWRARKIQAELSKLGIHLGLTTISRYLPKVDVGGNPHQRWMTFLRNHRDAIAGMDFFVVPTVRFTLLYVWFALDHGRRRVLHFNVTRHPSARWVIQQLRDILRSPDAPLSRPRQRRDLFRGRCPDRREIRNPSPANRIAKPLAERDRGTIRGNGSSRASRSFSRSR